jgi:hypothetical protein
VTRREAVSSGIFFRLSNYLKSDVKGGFSLTGRSWGCSGESYYTNLCGDFLKFISNLSAGRDSLGE